MGWSTEGGAWLEACSQTSLQPGSPLTSGGRHSCWVSAFMPAVGRAGSREGW